MEYVDNIGDFIDGKSKSQHVYQTLRTQIVNGELTPGTVLSIRELGTQLGVSRTPVKEAIARLTYEGWVEMLPNRCAMVSRLSTTDTLELLEVREALEHSSAYYAAQRRTEADIAELNSICEHHQSADSTDAAELAEWDSKFHLAVAKATYNQQLYSMINQVFEKLARISLPITAERAGDSIRQHLAIRDAILSGNAQDARRLMTDHLRDVQNSTKAYQYQHIHLFK